MRKIKKIKDKYSLLVDLIIQYFEVDSDTAWNFTTDYMIKAGQLKEKKP